MIGKGIARGRYIVKNQDKYAGTKSPIYRSSWEQVFLPLQAEFWWAWIFFFSFIAIGAITILNLIIAVLVDVVSKHNIDS